MQPQFIKSGERFININAIVSFEILATGQGDVRLANSQRILLEPKEARWLAECLARFSEEFRPVREFPSGSYPVLSRMAPAAVR